MNQPANRRDAWHEAARALNDAEAAYGESPTPEALARVREAREREQAAHEAYKEAENGTDTDE